jgi:hypothetical protein
VTVRRLAAALSLGVLAFAALPAASGAFDLTGTWVGRWSCQGFEGVPFKSSRKPSILLISQTDDTLAASIDGAFAYNGGAIPDLRDPDTQGEVALAQCATDSVPHQGGESELLRAKVKVDPQKGSGSFKGLSVVESDFPDVLTCKYSYTRVDTEDPGLSACP